MQMMKIGRDDVKMLSIVVLVTILLYWGLSFYCYKFSIRIIIIECI